VHPFQESERAWLAVDTARAGRVAPRLIATVTSRIQLGPYRVLIIG
jgi:hypothetical protein